MIDGSFIDWLKDFIPRKDDPFNCEIIDVKISCREVYFTYMTLNGEENEYSLTIDLW